MKNYYFLLCLFLSVCLVTPLSWADRYAYSADGNQHDHDDENASPLALALVAWAGQQDRLVHFDYNNHLGDNDPVQAATHKAVVLKAAEYYGIAFDVLFDNQSQLAESIENLSQQINASSESDRLYLMCAGPMETCYRGIDAADDEKEAYVTVITHSPWNNKHADTPQMTHTLKVVVTHSWWRSNPENIFSEVRGLVNY